MLSRCSRQLLFCRRTSLAIIGNVSRSMSSSSFGPKDIGIKKLGDVKDPKQVSESEWKKVLPAEAYEVARNSGTERPFSGAFDKFFEKGRYVCLCCGAELFNSDSKYWSGCGWPAFSKSIDNDMNIIRLEDNSMGMKRVEVRCKQCNAHLGHVFDDGPKETGERYCINSVSMAFEKADT
uniref:Peptide-methionine (R)-S-oxide reductase n=1 Tax=Haemonchus contortus TaxID=6289 RepID=W6NGV2_HAECO